VPEGSQRTTITITMITRAGENDLNLVHSVWFYEMIRDVHEAGAFSIICFGYLDPSGCLIDTPVVPAFVRQPGPQYWGIKFKMLGDN